MKYMTSLQTVWCFGFLWNPSNLLAFLRFMAEAPHNIHVCLQLSDLRDNLSINMPPERRGMYLQRIPSSACNTTIH